MYLYWQCPGGKIEQNELYNQAIKRELVEEIGINFEITPDYIQTNTYKGFNYDPKQPWKFIVRKVYLYQIKTTTRYIEQNLKQDTEIENFTQWNWKTIDQLKSLQIINSLQQWITYQNGSKLSQKQ